MVRALLVVTLLAVTADRASAACSEVTIAHCAADIDFAEDRARVDAQLAEEYLRPAYEKLSYCAATKTSAGSSWEIAYLMERAAVDLALVRLLEGHLSESRSMFAAARRRIHALQKQATKSHEIRASFADLDHRAARGDAMARQRQAINAIK